MPILDIRKNIGKYMFQDVQILIDFYSSDLGKVVSRIIQKKIISLTPHLKNQKILGLGYTSPFLEPLQPFVDRLILAMPAPQGFVAYPKNEFEKNTSLLTHENQLPFPDCFFDIIFVSHLIENTESLTAFLKETWRVLADHGKIIMLVPNRKGIWSQFSKTPFGHGRPFTTRQIRSQLDKSRFSFLKRERMLYFPPVNTRFILRYAKTWENAGHQFYRSFSGALLVEAQKNLYQECVATSAYKPILNPQMALKPLRYD